MSGIGRASVLIGAGTIVSRLTGFLRAVVLVSAVGATTEAGNAFDCEPAAQQHLRHHLDGPAQCRGGAADHQGGRTR
jgi:hypothetical protein